MGNFVCEAETAASSAAVKNKIFKNQKHL